MKYLFLLSFLFPFFLQASPVDTLNDVKQKVAEHEQHQQERQAQLDSINAPQGPPPSTGEVGAPPQGVDPAPVTIPVSEAGQAQEVNSAIPVYPTATDLANQDAAQNQNLAPETITAPSYPTATDLANQDAERNPSEAPPQPSNFQEPAPVSEDTTRNPSSYEPENFNQEPVGDPNTEGEVLTDPSEAPSGEIYPPEEPSEVPPQDVSQEEGEPQEETSVVYDSPEEGDTPSSEEYAGEEGVEQERSVSSTKEGFDGKPYVNYDRKTQVFYKKRCEASDKTCFRHPVFTNIKSVVFNYQHRRGVFANRDKTEAEKAFLLEAERAVASQ